MNKTGPIIVIDDDEDDQELLRELFAELKIANQICIFDNGQDALEFLRQPGIKPFLIISDINMPSMDGFEMRGHILNDPPLATKCIPFLFCTTGASMAIVHEAYARSVQGIFQKPSNFNEWKNVISSIVNYWSQAISPNSY